MISHQVVICGFLLATAQLSVSLRTLRVLLSFFFNTNNNYNIQPLGELNFTVGRNEFRTSGRTSSPLSLKCYRRVQFIGALPPPPPPSFVNGAAMSHPSYG